MLFLFRIDKVPVVLNHSRWVTNAAIECRLFFSFVKLTIFTLAARNPYADEDTFALVYGVFAGRANSVRSALAVAEQRFADVPEFQSMDADCQNAYFAIRQQLLAPILNKTIEQLLA